MRSGSARRPAECRSTSPMAVAQPIQLVRDPVAVKGLNPRGKIKHVNVGVRISASVRQ